MKKRVIALMLVLLMAAGISGCAGPVNADSENESPIMQEYWPEDGWRTSTPEEQGMDSQVLADMVGSISDSIDSVTIIRNGYLVNETYFYPYQKGFKHAMNSCTKSVLSALVGIAIEEGAINSIDDKVLDYFPDANIANNDARKQDMTVRDLLTMTTGLDWQVDGNVSTSEMTASPDWTKYALDLPMKDDPGTSFNYCNGAANIMSAILQNATGKTAAEYAAEKLAPLGMKDLFWSADPEGVSTGYSGIYMEPHDMAKFGYLYLNKGVWNGQQIIPQSWVEESTKQQVSGGWTPIFPGYGYMWWMSRFGGYAALGFGGNYIFVVPKKNLVVVFTGGIFNNQDLFKPGELMEQYIIPSVKSDKPLAPNPAAADALRAAVEAVGEPAAVPVDALPAIAAEISGKPLVVTGGDGSSVLTLTFEEASSEFTVASGSVIKKAGLDNIYRISGEANAFGVFPGSHKALKGVWLDENTLQVFEQDMEDGFETVFTIDFEGNAFNLNIKYNLGFEQNYEGTVG